MPFYPNEVIQQLKSEADITAVIEQFLPLKRSGNGRYVGVCPFHDDHSPSMYVNPTLGIYKCFACGAGGDVFKFVQEHEKIDFNAAVKWVAYFCSFELPNVGNPERAEITEERELVRKLNELACEWFEEQLTRSPKALQYLNSRHISEPTRKQFHIGYAPDGREGFVGYAAKKGFSPKECVKAGLAVEKENGGISDKFRDRLMIAIQNISGVVVAFGGRDLSGKSPAKHMNSPMAIIDKRRNRHNEAIAVNIIGDIKDKTCIMFDDIIDTAGTITMAADIIMEKGAKSVRAVATHPVLSGPAYERINKSALIEVITTNSIPIKEGVSGKIKVISIGNLFGEVINNVYNHKSISKNFIV